MNNEVVAWIDKDGNIFYTNGIAHTLPLYTHPVKELTAQEVMEQTHRKISEAHWKVKELTDEEILKMAADMFHYTEYKVAIQFARAILRKAQDK